MHAVSKNLRAIVLVVASDVLLGGILHTGAIAASDPADAEYAAAIEQARAGNTQAALPIVENHYRQNPADPAAAYNYILVLGWANRPADALAVYESLGPGERPAYVEASAARDYRDAGRFDQAIALYRAGRERFPDDLTFAYGEILTLTDANRAGEAADEAAALLQLRPADPDLLSSALYANARTDRYADSLALSQRILALAPQDREARRQQALALQRLGAFAQALDLAEQSPDLFTPDEMRRFASDSAAALVRWGELPAADDAERLASVDRAIEELDRRIAAWKAQGRAADGDILNARFNRMLALEDRGRNDEVIAEYQALKGEGATVPSYVLKVVADAYETRREPQTARLIYEAALADNPKDFQTRLGLFYSQIETEDYETAFGTIDALVADQPPFLQGDGDSQPVPNQTWLRAALAAAMARYYAGDAAEAQRRVESMVALAPENAALRQALGTILAGRGKPRAADRQYAIAQAINPDDVTTAAARADVAITLGDRVQGAATLDNLLRRTPSNGAVVQLRRRLDELAGPELIVRWNTNFQHTQTPVGGTAFGVDTQLFSAPIDHAYRIYAAYGYSTAALPEGDIVNNHTALGLEYTGREIGATAELSNDSSPRSHAGLRGSLAWAPADEWRLSGNVQIVSGDTPLRALKNNVTANSWAASVGYTPSDLQSYNFTAEILTFSDDNVRTILFANSTQRLLTSPRFTLDAIVDLYASHSTLKNAAYFNPSDDFAGSLTASATQVLYRKYDFAYSHNFSLTASDYWENGFGSRFAWSIYYEQRLKLSDNWQGALGVRLRQQPYDGNAENSVAIIGSIDWRF